MQPQLMVNGRKRALGDVGGHVTLLQWLRAGGLTGAKEGCAEGECGACAVVVVRPDGEQSRWTAINSCLVPVAGLDGQEVVTAEGLGSPGNLHPTQHEMAERGGSQCGYCTPGFICSMASEFYRADRHSTALGRAASQPEAGGGSLAARNGSAGGDVEVDPTAPGRAPDHEHGPNGFDLHALSGNLCRCTGYRPIRDAAYALGQPEEGDPMAVRMRQPAPAPVRTRISHRHGFVRPADLSEALAELAEHPDAVLVAGSTDWGVELNIRHTRAPHTIAVDRLAELRTLEVTDQGFAIGAALTLSEIERGLGGRIPLMAEMFPQFASRLIRNGATLGGNLGTGSPIGDSLPVLLALEASLVLASSDGDREVQVADYFTGYRQTVRRPGELIRTIRIPAPLAPLSAFHKMAKRRFDDISSVAVAFAVVLDSDGDGDPVVTRAAIGLGGVAATPIRASATEAALTGMSWTARTIEQAADVMGAEGTPMSDHRASAGYRSAMLRSALTKFHAQSTPAQKVA